MLILVTYDIDTTDPAGARRLHRVARQCQRYGVRVQMSVFECRIDATQYTAMKQALEREIDPALDSVRFYRLGDHAQGKVETFGLAHGLNMEDTLIL